MFRRSKIVMITPYKLILIGFALLLICAAAAYLKGGSTEYVIDVFMFKKIVLMSINISVGYIVIVIGVFKSLVGTSRDQNT